jgi:hypothetical protein
MRLLIVGLSVLLSVLLVASSATAEPAHASAVPLVGQSLRTSFGTWPSCDGALRPALERSLVLPPQLFDQDAVGQPVHAVAIEHSDSYQTRAKIHKYASFATLPLFAAELALGESAYNDTQSNAKKTAHAVVGTGIVALFAVNTVTGLWNMFGEGRQDTDGRKLRLVHGLLMMAADAGFVATVMSAPSTGRNSLVTFNADAQKHRNLAIASVSVGTVGYLLMLLGNR